MIKKSIILILILLSIGCNTQKISYEYAPGDLIFQSLPHNDLVDTIEGATHSPYSHVGIVIKKENKLYVREALGDVHDTKLKDFLVRGRNKQYDVYKLKPTFEKYIPKLIAETEKYLGRPYDIRYRMDDEAIYCSELIYKAFQDATGLKMGKLVKLGDLEWGPHENFITVLENGPVPTERIMITPKDLAQAQQLLHVYSTYKKL